MLKKIALIDCDDVLTVLGSTFYDFMAKEYGKVYHRDPTAFYPSEWEICGGAPRESNFEEAKPYLKNYAKSEFVKHQPAFPGAVDGVSNLFLMDYELRVATSISDCEESKAHRRYNIENIFGNGLFSEIYHFPTMGRKIDYYKQFAGYDFAYVIDDYYVNAMDALEAGLSAIVLRQVCNSRLLEKDAAKIDPRIKICDSWEEIIDYIAKNEQTK